MIDPCSTFGDLEMRNVAKAPFITVCNLLKKKVSPLCDSFSNDSVMVNVGVDEQKHMKSAQKDD